MRAFPFAFNTPNILTGAAIYTPTVGDVLLQAWVEINTAWDGTTPLGDFGSFVGTAGLFNNTAGALVDMTAADFHFDAGDGMLVGNQDSSLSDMDAVGYLIDTSFIPAATSLTNPRNEAAFGFPVDLTSGARTIPGKFTSAAPLKMLVSTTGTTGGSDPGSTHGAAILYLVTATPT